LSGITGRKGRAGGVSKVEREKKPLASNWGMSFRKTGMLECRRGEAEFPV